jgi:spermidine synthase
MVEPSSQEPAQSKLQVLLLISVFVIATCGLVYELVAGTLASYLLGDSVTQFSTVIGVYLFSMGVGAFLSKYIKTDLIATFIRVEVLIALVGGFSAAFLFVMFEQVSAFRVLLYTQVSITGILVGLEIPLLMRILQDQYEFKDLVGNIFTFDYIGALLASLLFPLWLVPNLGLIRTAALFGMFNAAVAVWAAYAFSSQLKRPFIQQGIGMVALAALLGVFVLSGRIQSFAETAQYKEPVLYAESTPYQRLVLTRQQEKTRLYLNGNLQFDSSDEYRYHEALVHPGLASVPNPKQVLILGGGDGMAAREVLKYPSVGNVDLVDLDPAMTGLFKARPDLASLNDSSLHSPLLHVQNADAFQWVRTCRKSYDFICIDFPDPSNFSVGKLYTARFYEEVKRILKPGGIMVVQSTSPYVAPKSFWCVEKTLRSAGFHTVPYHAYVPSFGEWGFLMAMNRTYQVPEGYPAGLRFVTAATIAQMLSFPPDMAFREVDENRLDNQALVRYFEQEWAQYQE